jgi:tryptophanyl-tRNA synthetase
MVMSKPVILTGLRANDEFHLGNYLGGILPMVELQRSHAGEYQLNMFVPDLHSFTTPIDHSKLYRQIIDNLKIYVAAGIDLGQPDTYIYRQSFIPAHSELTVILNNFTYFGELQRMTQFKEKSEQLKHVTVSAGLFDYPVLMAADILIYGAQWVPVGDDQQQHLEFARDLGQKFNNKFGDIFTIPHAVKKQNKFLNLERGIRIRSLRNPEKKMSKSIEDPAGTIMLTDSPSEAAKKIMGATTDSLGKIHFDWEKQPGVSNLLQISALLEKRPQSAVINDWKGRASYGDLKKHVSELVKDFLTDLQNRLKKVDESSVLKKLKRDEDELSNVANQTLQKVQKAVGLRP